VSKQCYSVNPKPNPNPTWSDMVIRDRRTQQSCLGGDIDVEFWNKFNVTAVEVQMP